MPSSNQCVVLVPVGRGIKSLWKTSMIRLIAVFLSLCAASRCCLAKMESSRPSIVIVNVAYEGPIMEQGKVVKRVVTFKVKRVLLGKSSLAGQTLGPVVYRNLVGQFAGTPLPRLETGREYVKDEEWIIATEAVNDEPDYVLGRPTDDLVSDFSSLVDIDDIMPDVAATRILSLVNHGLRYAIGAAYERPPTDPKEEEELTVGENRLRFIRNHFLPMVYSALAKDGLDGAWRLAENPTSDVRLGAIAIEDAFFRDKGLGGSNEFKKLFAPLIERGNTFQEGAGLSHSLVAAHLAPHDKYVDEQTVLTLMKTGLSSERPASFRRGFAAAICNLLITNNRSHIPSSSKVSTPLFNAVLDQIEGESDEQVKDILISRLPLGKLDVDQRRQLKERSQRFDVKSRDWLERQNYGVTPR